jgi:polar amino acid transport system permease protein
VLLQPFACVAIAFFLNSGAYYGDIPRAGIDSVPAGQLEAVRSTGLSLQAIGYVVLPQAVRNVLSGLPSNTLEVAERTSSAAKLSPALGPPQKLELSPGISHCRRLTL